MNNIDSSQISPGVGQDKYPEFVFRHKFYKYIWMLWISLCILMAMPSKIWRFIENKKTEQLCNGLLDGNKCSAEEFLPFVKDCANQLRAKQKYTSMYLTKYLLCMTWTVLNPALAFVILDLMMDGKFRYLGIQIFWKEGKKFFTTKRCWQSLSKRFHLKLNAVSQHMARGEVHKN